MSTTATPTTESLTDAIRTSLGKLRILRESAAQRAERLKAARAAFEQTLADEMQKLEAEKRAIEAEESAVRGMALVEYDGREDKTNKEISAGVSIAIESSISYDAGSALAWAKEKGMCLKPESLDVKAFEKIAKVTPLPFVECVETPTVRIAADLSKALGPVTPSTPHTAPF